MSEDESNPEKLVHSCGTSPGRYCLRCGIGPYVGRYKESPSPSRTGRLYIRDPEPDLSYFSPSSLKAVSRGHVEDAYVIAVDYSALEEAVLASFSVDDLHLSYAYLYSLTDPELSGDDFWGD